jgi:hypothetical protein
MDEDSERKARALRKACVLRKVLEERCPGADFEDDDILKLVFAGFHTEVALALATEDALTEVLLGRIGVVLVLLKAFVKPASMFPCQGFAVLMLMFFMDLYATDL